MRPGIMLLAMFLLITGRAAADELRVKPERTLIASPVELVLSVKLAPGERVSFPGKPPLPDYVEVEAPPEEQTSAGEGGTIIKTAAWRIVPYTMGEVTIPAFGYEIIAPDGSKTAREAGPVKFYVESVRGDPNTAGEPKDIRPQVSRELRWSAYIAPLLALAAAAALLALAWRWYKKRPVKAVPPPPEPKRAAHEAALAELSALERESLFDAGKAREHFFRLSGIIRRYLENRYGVLALERTTAELESEINGALMRQEAREKLFRLLRACDLVKYAKSEPSRDHADDALRRAAEIVEITKPKIAEGGF